MNAGGDFAMKLLVTGGAGFIGSNFIRHMLETHPGISVVNLDALTYAGNPENLREPGRITGPRLSGGISTIRL